MAISAKLVAEPRERQNLGFLDGPSFASGRPVENA